MPQSSRVSLGWIWLGNLDRYKEQLASNPISIALPVDSNSAMLVLSVATVLMLEGVCMAA